MYGVGSSQFDPKDTNVFQSDEEILKNSEFMNSDLYYHHHHHHHHNPYQQQQSSGLMRYSSAPSTFFATLIDSGGGGGGNDLVNNESSSSESETMFAKFMSADSDSPDLQFPAAAAAAAAIKHEEAESVQQMMYQTPHMASRGSVIAHTTTFSSSYKVSNTEQVKMNGGNRLNLMRQSSSPANLFSNLNVENGVAVMREVGKFSVSNGNNGEANPSTSRLSGHVNLSSGPSSCSRFMPQIPENGKASTETGIPENGHLRNNNCSNGYYVPSFSNDSWIDSTKTSLKRNREDDVKSFLSFHTLDTLNGDQRNYTPGLTHHLSLPKTSSEKAAIEKYLQFQQDQVPCKIRAKRGFATHPRSIAERVRRTRISERMRKLQDLFPNIDKQANTAEMLDLAVEFIKDLQKQVKTLKDTRVKCTCSCSSKLKLSDPTG